MNSVKRILLVEDDPNDVELILTALDEFNLANEVVVVNDGAEALDYLYREGNFSSRPVENPVVVLLDLKLPKINGIQVLQKIKSDEKLKTLPVCILTSSRESNDLEKCYKLGVNAYVVKPVKFDDFIQQVKQLGMFWAIINEPPTESGKSNLIS